MDAASALADLLELSSQVETAVVLDAAGTVVASSRPDDPGSERLAAAARGLVEAAGASAAAGGRTLTQLEAALPEASVFVVRDGANAIAATTGPQPASGLVLYDLRTCLRGLAQAAERKPARRRRKQGPPDA